MATRNKKRDGKRKRRAPFLADMEGARVRNAFRHITIHKEDYIVRENGRIVDIKEAVRRYKATGDDKWVLHILASNVGYFANTIGKLASKYNIDPSDYVYCVYYGLKYAMDKCDPEKVRLSYLASGVYMISRREVDRDLRERKMEVSMEGFAYNDDEGEMILDSEHLDRLFADFGIYDVPLYDEDTCKTHDG